MLDHRWVVGAFVLGLLFGWFTTWVCTRTLVGHYQSEVLYWRGMWRKADKRLTRLLLRYVRDSEVEEVEDPLPAKVEPVNRATAIERLIRDRDVDQDPPEDRD